MTRLFGGERIFTICSAVLTQYQHVSDRQNDGRNCYNNIAFYISSHGDVRQKQNFVPRFFFTRDKSSSFFLTLAPDVGIYNAVDWKIMTVHEQNQSR